MDEPTEEISPFDVGHAVGLFDGSETLGHLQLQSSMQASPVVVTSALAAFSFSNSDEPPVEFAVGEVVQPFVSQRSSVKSTVLNVARPSSISR